MAMTSRERMLTALANGRPDRLPCQVHGWMGYYLDTYLGGLDWWQAYERFDMDHAIYVSPTPVFDDKALANWREKTVDLGLDADGNHLTRRVIATPKGELTEVVAANDITNWHAEYLLKTPADIEIFSEYWPTPVAMNLEAVAAASARLGDKGIIRMHPYSPGQGSPWQSFCYQFGTEQAIMLGMDEPELLRAALDAIADRTVRAIELSAGVKADMVEVGGGAGSSTVISPNFYREFGLPYDQRQNRAFREIGVKVVNHFCGGLMPMLDLVAESGADGLETMTPPSMGGDCDLAEASRRVGDRLFFIGGFDQNRGFEHGAPEVVREQVFACFEATKDYAGYIIAPSDHFFHGDPANLQAFVDACKECVY